MLGVFMKRVYIIPHTHWDREWYLPFEHHRLRLVWFMDALLALLEKDPLYHHFHLDGQTIILDDYLDVKPEKKALIAKYIQEGRLSVGPWYILQDEYLISGEANVRNMLIGLQESRKYGQPSLIGYFPDAFGNISQAPQILQGFGIDNAVFGRGINAVGFNNQVESKQAVDEYPSELTWRSPDGSEVLGIFMANWYNNGSEIPNDTEEAKEFLDQAIANAESIASTDALLLMNGCDHQPVQEDLADIIKRVQPIMSEAKLIQGSLVDYVEEIKSLVGEMKVFEGEMNSQYTEGWWTLTGTASSRIYLKQMNDEAQKLLENYLEPIETLAFINGKNYDREGITHTWKMLLQNHPHDSICGCSVDEVHDEMVTRFNNVKHYGSAMLADTYEHIGGTKVTTEIDKDNIQFSVFNPLNWSRADLVNVVIDLPETQSFSNPVVVDCDGNICPSNVVDLGRQFDYTLPKDRFRQVNYVNRYEFEVMVSGLEALELSVYLIKESEEDEVTTESSAALVDVKNAADRTLENDRLLARVEKNGSLTLQDKQTNRTYHGLNVFEDGGDVGNEYIFKSPEDDYVWKSEVSTPVITCERCDEIMTVYRVEHEALLPLDGDVASSSRNDAKVTSKITTVYTLKQGEERVDVTTTIDNPWKDHRLRALFPSGVITDQHNAHGQYDVIKRNNNPWEGWKNPSNCLKQRYFVDNSDETGGLMVANKGLMEYEILDNSAIALTLLRSIGELGDWGDFPTPGAQCLGETSVAYSIIPHGGGWCDSKAYRKAYEFNVAANTSQMMLNKPVIQLPFKMMEGPFVLTALKKCEERNSLIYRFYNISETPEIAKFTVSESVKAVYRTNLDEKREHQLVSEDGVTKIDANQKAIVTVEFELA